MKQEGVELACELCVFLGHTTSTLTEFPSEIYHLDEQ